MLQDLSDENVAKLDGSTIIEMQMQITKAPFSTVKFAIMRLSQDSPEAKHHLYQVVEQARAACAPSTGLPAIVEHGGAEVRLSNSQAVVTEWCQTAQLVISQLSVFCSRACPAQTHSP